MKKKIVVGMSGGVDSNMAVKQLLDRGYDVMGVTLVMHDGTDASGAAEYAKKLGIEHKTIDCRDLFKEKVIGNFLDEYLHARTPNPCVVCNRYVKIRMLCDYAKSIGVDNVSTGHYVGVGLEGERYYIKKGSDSSKDQSYVLWNLTQDELGMLYFPLSDENKADIVAAAEKSGLIPDDYSESMEICFVENNDYAGYIENACGAQNEGNFVDIDGNIIGRHKGLIHYTIGQRKGLGLSLGYPAFVTKLDTEKNEVTVSTEDRLFTDRFYCSALNFQKLTPCDGVTFRTAVKIRYAARPVGAEVYIKDGIAEVKTDETVRAVTPGQSAVFYDGDAVLFGGFIK